MYKDPIQIAIYDNNDYMEIFYIATLKNKAGRK